MYKHTDHDKVVAAISSCTDLEDKFALALAYQHAMRVTELRHVKVGDFQDGHIRIAALKSGKIATQRLIETPFNEAAMFTELEHERKLNGETWSPDDYLFPNRYIGRKKNRNPFKSRMYYWRLLQRLAPGAGIEKYLAHPHVLRHTAAYVLFDSAGGDDRHAAINIVQRYLRHENINNTAKYLEVNDQEASAAAIAAFGGSHEE
jgi:integrase